MIGEAQVVISQSQLLPWFLTFPGIALLLYGRIRAHRFSALAGLLLIAAGATLATCAGQLTLPAMATLGVLVAAGWLVGQGQPTWAKVTGHVLFVASSLLLRLHLAPGFDNPLAIEGVVSEGAASNRIFLNQDKLVSSLWLVLYAGWITYSIDRPSRSVIRGIGWGVLGFMPLAAGALLAGVVNWDPKIPQITVMWWINNLLLVCFAEEIFFRGYIQHGLAKLWAQRAGQTVGPLLITSMLFGVAHLGGGTSMAVLSGFAGVAYGLAYRAGGLAAAILAHFALNALHFHLLTYPLLA